MPTDTLPIPPVDMRALVGPTDETAFDNPSGNPVFEGVPAQRIFDFGCGCGRLARQLMQQREQPERYLGVDLHKGMVEWCQRELAPHAPQFEFRHHDVFNASFNPDAERDFAPLPGETGSYTFAVAHSVFTHILQEHVEPYLREIARLLSGGGVLRSTWFTFARRDFPMLQDFQHGLYINHVDPTNATIFDRDWIRDVASNAGLTITRIVPPAVRGFHWTLDLKHTKLGLRPAEWPTDEAIVGKVPPPLAPLNSHRIGLQD